MFLAIGFVTGYNLSNHHKYNKLLLYAVVPKIINRSPHPIGAVHKRTFENDTVHPVSKFWLHFKYTKNITAAVFLCEAFRFLVVTKTEANSRGILLLFS